MVAFLEVWTTGGAELVALGKDTATIGRAVTNDVALPDDSRVSRLHAVLERRAGGWAVRDLGSRNGTFVNSERLAGERALRHRDEVRVGTTRLIYRQEADAVEYSATRCADPPPELTRREHEVLGALFAPARAGGVFSEPASTQEMAAELFVTQAAIKQHLGRLYDKFGIPEGERRRAALANEALRRGAVDLGAIRRHSPARGASPTPSGRRD